MSKRAKPDISETSTSELAKCALETEKDINSDLRTKQSVLQSERPIEQPVVTSKEIGGQKGLEPTRFGDWEKNGRCTDF